MLNDLYQQMPTVWSTTITTTTIKSMINQDLLLNLIFKNINNKKNYLQKKQEQNENDDVSKTLSLFSTIEPYDYFFRYNNNHHNNNQHQHHHQHHHKNQSELNFTPLISTLSTSYYSDINLMKNNNDTTKLNMSILIVLSIILICLILATIIGNVFVISAVILERSLRSVGNYLVISLAITDLLVACLVMPIGAIYEIMGEWRMGIKLCEIWTFIDVLCCTTSIFHLLAISCDRLWAVTTIDYIHRRKSKHVCIVIGVIWSFSAIISLGPMLGWKDNEFEQRIVERKECMISQDISYQIFATISSFYAPSILLLLQYYRIYQVAKTRLRIKRQRYQYRIRRRPSFYRTRKESEIKEFPRVTHRVSLNANEEFFSTSTAIQPPISSSSGVYSSSTNTDYTANTNTTTNTTTLSTDRTSSIISISPPILATLKPTTLQSPEAHLPNVSTTKRFSIVEFFHPQPVEQKLGNNFIDFYDDEDDDDDEEDEEKYNMTHFGHYYDNNDLQSNETSIDESTIIVGPEPASNIVVYIDDYGSTICSSCDPTVNHSSSGNEISYYQHGEHNNNHNHNNHPINEENEYDDDDDDNPFKEIAINIAENEKKNNETSEQNAINDEESSIERPLSSESPLNDSGNQSESKKIVNIYLAPPISSPIKEIENPPINNNDNNDNLEQQQQQPNIHHNPRHHSIHHHRHSKKHKRRRIKKLKFKNKILRFDNNNNNNGSQQQQQQQQDNKQESKAAKTLTIITGVFIICWLPFFVLALVIPLCGEHCYINKYTFDFFIWLGWANSTLNPFLYTIFSPDFRNAFKKLSKRIKK